MPSSSVSEYRLDAKLASRLARIALGHVTREYPNVLGSEPIKGARAPKAVHPVFYGSYDWHSCVHSYWLLASVLRLFPRDGESAEIRALIEDAFTQKKIAGELETLAPSPARGFERPYGWAWALMLAAELSRHTSPPARKWAANFEPLAQLFVERFEGYLEKAPYPIRSGVHGNTAFALILALEYADANDKEFGDLVRGTARRWYSEDAGCKAWEPSGEDFLSRALVEAECMRRVLGPDAFGPWLKRFLPRLAHEEPATLFTPAEVSDRSDGRIVHLDGLNLSRAWCWRALAGSMAGADPARAIALKTAEHHLAVALPHIAGDYMGEHWLASFALLAVMGTS